jgi:type IV secretion system protein TrbL
VDAKEVSIMAMNFLALDYGPDLINNVANQYINAINSGFGLIQGDVTRLLNIFIILSIMWSATLWALSDDHVIVQLARKIVYIGIFVWIIQNWQMLTDKLARSFMDLGLKAGGFADANYYTAQPGNIAYLGYTTAQPLIDQIGRLCGPVAFFKNFPEIAFLTVAIIAIIASFCVITVQVVMALVTFKFGSLVGFVLMPFAVVTKTAFMAERPLGWVVGSGVRLMVLTLVLGIGNNIFQTLKMPPGSTVTTYEAFCIALAAVLLMVFSLVASRLASDLIVGGPSLGVGTAINTTASTYSTAVGGVTSRPSVIAVKAAAAVSTKGASLAYSAGGAAARGVGRAVSGGAAKAATNTATMGGSTNSAPKVSGSATSTIASRIHGKGPGGKGGSSTT